MSKNPDRVRDNDGNVIPNEEILQRDRDAGCSCERVPENCDGETMSDATDGWGEAQPVARSGKGKFIGFISAIALAAAGGAYFMNDTNMKEQNKLQSANRDLQVELAKGQDLLHAAVTDMPASMQETRAVYAEAVRKAMKDYPEMTVSGCVTVAFQEKKDEVLLYKQAVILQDLNKLAQVFEMNQSPRENFEPVMYAYGQAERPCYLTDKSTTQEVQAALDGYMFQAGVLSQKAEHARVAQKAVGAKVPLKKAQGRTR